MLELGELQRSEAIEHALAGAELLAALHGHPSSEPDWVAVHEEQCCRHGALWVQAAFNESETAQTIAWGHQALVLLDRLGHPYFSACGTAFQRLPSITATLCTWQQLLR
ncbi:MAG: hypothetical protein NTW02_09795 [Cyanobium sp. LacPavin_0920_WC12_MAG_62_9]|nr:hypothetical protein [Cyanobium sp. LacPavin_0920_WC12_MAG_62_9]